MKQLASPMRLAAATLVTFATLAAASAGSAAVVNNAQDDEFQWSGSIAAGDAIEIKAANGPLRAEIALGNTVEVWATKEGPANDRAEVDIEVVEHDGGVTICTIYPSSWGGDNSCEPGSEGRISSNRNKTKVSFTVRVPAGVRFVGTTMNGIVSVEDLQSDVEATTMNGAINVSTTGWARATTMNGAVVARMGQSNWTGELEIKSMNGSVTVVLPANASTEINATTMNGRIESDWSLETSGWLRNKARGTIGSGGRKLELSTMNGAIRIRRSN